MNEKTTDVQTNEDVLKIEPARAGNDLTYRITNRSAQPVWIFIHVPTLQNGEYTFAKDAAWLEAEAGLLLVRKVDTPVPDDVKAERVQSGAVQLAPGATRQGRIELGDHVETRAAYRSPARHDVSRIVMEVGWLPVRDGQPREDLTWEGEPFAYLRPEVEPGGQRFVRSTPLAW